MKKILKTSFVNGVALSLVSWLFPGIKLSFDPAQFILVSILITLIIKLIKPIFNLAFLPINVLTLGLFRWVRLIFALGILIYLNLGVSLEEFFFPGLNFQGVVINPYHLSSFYSLILGAFFFDLARKVIFWIIKKN
ncbi:hypothetical protein COT75_00340 [Candidatus Beckwithbacteria bacterium CG10_big_fil_rev_8_21_14_0_10_34_10]|uniref:Phage holin family protein n=1 Tax=Candidatus Beckwithbacteria bacterium CG10_big_fil_rev_8_21_14_0_10_34_10 TaxID=1974495 RepID=A0A2H0WCI4_9BACT|nr:MAG: hypothetical protein COT75_00340 [Candidatus Beckwithbacteria bacterium CG10_big_fil_rev_8_21_14_0_10_34_10]